MEKIPMCRICLVENIRMYKVVDKNLHKLYKTLTDNAFLTEDRRPMLACYLCFAKLKECSQLQRKCLEAEELFAQMMNEASYAPNHSIKISIQTTRSIVDVGQMESIAVKEEIPFVCERPDDVIEPKEEHQSGAMLLRSEKNSELDSKHDVPLLEFKIEVEEEEQEVLSEKRKASDTKQLEMKNINNSYSDIEDMPAQQSPYPPPRRLHGIPVVTTPGSINIQGETVPAEQTPGGHIRRVQAKPAVPLCFDVVERVEASGMSDEETEEMTEEDPWHVRRWMGDLPGPSTNAVTNSEVEVQASSSELKSLPGRAPRREVVNGSDLDSECDDEFDVETLPGASRKDIPDTEELEESIQEMVNAIDTGMDDAADRLLGTSPSFTWLSDFESFRSVREEFTGPTPGSLKDYDSPYDAFIDIWDRNILDLIVRETNRYAHQTIEAKRNRGTLSASSRFHLWTDTNADEIMLLFVVFMYMALDPRTSITEYWIKDEVLQLPGFRRLMSYNRYILLSKFLHFVDNTAVTSQQLPQTENAFSARLSAKVDKLSPVIEHLGEKFKSLYNLGPDVSIDESLTLFKGRLSWVQTIKSTSAQFGIKSYELCESSTGYMAGFRIYTGMFDSSGGDNYSLGVNMGEKSTKVVLELLQGLEHRGHCVVMDIFYCPSLARYLKSLGFDCLGTLRVCRRNVPKDISKVQKKLKKGTIISRHCGDVSIIAWMDSKMVNIISTFHRPDTYMGSKAGKSLVKPVCVRDYNTTMGGVDLKDQKLAMYLLERKRGVKWYIKMYKRLLNVSIHNALVMYLSSLKRRDKPPVTHREFRYELAETLLSRHRPCLLQEISQPVQHLTRLKRDILHEPEYLKGGNARKRCVICLRKKEDKKVHSKCTQCDAFLCFGDCWRIWHSAAQLSGEEIRGRKRRRTNV